MPKLNFSARVRENLERVICNIEGCEFETFALDQNQCNACEAYLCFSCAAIKRVYCCDAYEKRFWPGLMKPEVAALNVAIRTGNADKIEQAIADFGVGSTDDKVEKEIERQNARILTQAGSRGGCVECHSTYVREGDTLCAPCRYWHELAKKHEMSVPLVRRVFKEWNTREFNTFDEFVASLLAD